MKNPRYTNEEKTGILLDLDDSGSSCVFVEPKGAYADLYQQASSGAFGPIAAYTPPEEPDPLEQLANKIRMERNDILSGSDWTQVADAPVDQAAWAEYRQALRDIPQQAGFPHDVAWPTPPTSA